MLYGVYSRLRGGRDIVIFGESVEYTWYSIIPGTSFEFYLWVFNGGTGL